MAQMPNLHFRNPVTIANGESLSGALDLVQTTAVAIQLPAAWTAAGLTFQASADGETWGNLLDDAGAEVTVAALATSGSPYVKLDPSTFFGVRYLKVRSGTSGAAVNQLAARILTVIGRHM